MPDIRELTEREPIPSLPEPRERRRLRLAFGITQAKLASVLGVTRQMIIAYEKGASEPAGDKREEYAAILAAWKQTETQRAKET